MNYLIKPWDHQKRAIELASIQDNFALLMDMGTGKTATAINVLRHWCTQAGKPLSGVIFCPPVVVKQWEGEFRAHSKLGPYVIPLNGTGKKRLKALEEGINAGPRIYITNYETLTRMKPVYEKLLSADLDFIICDESHKCKNPQAKRTKAAIILSDKVRKKLILTGTAVLNNALDIFAQYRILDGGQTFGNNYFVFRAQYFEDKNAAMPSQKHFPNWQPKKGTLNKLNELIYKKAIRVTKEECLDLPPLVRVKIPVELSKEQRSAYDEMKAELITYINGKACTAQIALTKLLRLQQIVSGFATIEEEVPELAGIQVNASKVHIARFENVPRIQALKELLTDVIPETEKVIIWASFQENYRSIGNALESLSIRYVELHGKKTAKQKQEAIEDFRSPKGARVIIANQKAGGVGLNLTEASYSVYFSRSYSLEDDVQSEARNYRGGSEQHTKVTRIDLVAENSVDEIILDALNKKQNLAAKILDMKEQLELF